jgi:hypothetical protein
MTIARWVWVSLFVAGTLLFCIYHYHQRLWRCLLYSLASGLGTLGLLLVFRHFVPLQLSITPLSVVASALLGPPGIIAMLLIPLV